VYLFCYMMNTKYETAVITIFTYLIIRMGVWDLPWNKYATMKCLNLTFFAFKLLLL